MSNNGSISQEVYDYDEIIGVNMNNNGNNSN